MPLLTSPLTCLISCSLSKYGGNETHALNLATLLAAKGAEVTVATRSKEFACTHGRELNEVGVHLLTTPFGSGNLKVARNIWAAAMWLRPRQKNQFSRLVCFGPGGFHRSLRSCLEPDGKFIYWESGDGSAMKSARHNRMLKAAHVLAATSSPVAAKMTLATGRQIDILPPLTGVSLGNCRTRSGNQSTKTLRVAFLGRLCHAKGIDMLFSAWEHLQAPNVELHMYGGGIGRPKHKECASSIGKITNVYFHGEYSRLQLGDILQDTDLVILPSRSEGLPHVLLEAMAYGVPFIATDVGGVSALGVGNPDVAIVPPTEDNLGSALQEMISKLRNETLDPRRLQRWFARYYSKESVELKWLESLGVQ